MIDLGLLSTTQPRLSSCDELMLLAAGPPLGREENLRVLRAAREELNTLMAISQSRKNELLARMRIFETVKSGAEGGAADALNSSTNNSRKRGQPDDNLSMDMSMSEAGGGQVDEANEKEEAWQAKRRQSTIAAVRAERKGKKKGQEESESEGEDGVPRYVVLPDDAGRVRAAHDTGMAFWTANEPFFRSLTEDDLRAIADVDEHSDPAFRIPMSGETMDGPKRWESAANLLGDGSDEALDKQPLSLRLLACLIEDPSGDASGKLSDMELTTNAELSIASSAASHSLESAVRAELSALGLLDSIDDGGGADDDEVVRELRKFQAMLRDHLASHAPRRRPLYLRAEAELPRDRKRDEIIDSAKSLESCFLKHGAKVSKAAKSGDGLRHIQRWDTLMRDERPPLRSRPPETKGGKRPAAGGKSQTQARKSTPTTYITPPPPSYPNAPIQTPPLAATGRRGAGMPPPPNGNSMSPMMMQQR